MFSKRNIIDRISNDGGITKVQALNVTDSLFDEMTNALVLRNEEVALPGIGKLVVKHRAARKGMNPFTKKPVEIAAKTVVTFRAAKSLKDMLKLKK